MVDFLNPRARVLTFDLNGTLVDWEAVAKRYFANVLARKGSEINPEYFYECWYYRHHLPMVAEPFRPYGENLQRSLKAALTVFCLDAVEEDGADFRDIMASSEPFPEAIDVLRRLSTAYELAVISNNEWSIIQKPIERLGSPFSYVVTAESAEAYKPDRRPFEVLLEKAEADPDDVIHIAQSQWADLPRSIGMRIRTIWINRQHQELHSGCPAPGAEYHDLCPLPDLLLRNVTV